MWAEMYPRVSIKLIKTAANLNRASLVCVLLSNAAFNARSGSVEAEPEVNSFIIVVLSVFIPEN